MNKETGNGSPEKTALTQERLKKLLSYAPETGEFYRLTRRTGSYEVGDLAGGIPPSLGYRMISLDGVVYYGHRLAWLYMTGSWPKFQVDHRNCDKADNRWTNLREATPTQNARNRAGWASSGAKHIGQYSTQKRGMRYYWTIRFDGKIHRSSVFSSKDEAIISRDEFFASKNHEFLNTTHCDDAR